MLEPQPAIELFGLVLREPVTALTDVMIAVICWVAYFKLNALPQRSEIQRLFKYHFLFMGVGTFLGGMVGHALMNYLPEIMKLPGWIAGMVAITFLERGVIQYANKHVRPSLGAWFLRFNIIELVAFLGLLIAFLNFKFVIIHGAFGMLAVVTGFAGFIYFKEKSLGSKLILLAVLVSVLGILMFVLKIGLHKWFNHADLGHVFMMVSTVLFYKGARDLIET